MASLRVAWLAALVIALLGARPALAAGASVESASPEQKRAAQKTFEAADGLYEAGRYDEAKAAYRASYEIVSSPNSLLMEARSARELGRLGEAYGLLEQTIELAEQGAGRYAQTASAAREERTALRPRVGFVVLSLPDAPERTWIEIDGRRLEPDAASRPVPLTPGERRFGARAPDGRQIERTLLIESNTSADLELRFQPRSPARPSDPAAGRSRNRRPSPAPAPSATPSDAGGSSTLSTAAYVAAGVGVIGFVAFGVFGALNNATYHELEDTCPDASCATDREDDIDRGRRYQLLANIGLGVGVVGTVAGATLYVTSLGSESAPDTAIVPGGVTLRGRF